MTAATTTRPATRAGRLSRPDGASLYYEVTGVGPALLFRPRARWQPPEAGGSRSRISRTNFTCISFSHRGFAPSTCPSDAPDPHDYADDAIAPARPPGDRTSGLRLSVHGRLGPGSKPPSPIPGVWPAWYWPARRAAFPSTGSMIRKSPTMARARVTDPHAARQRGCPPGNGRGLRRRILQLAPPLCDDRSAQSRPRQGDRARADLDHALSRTGGCGADHLPHPAAYRGKTIS